MIEKSWTHWTRFGVFELKQIYAARSALFELYFKGEFLGRYIEPTSAAADVIFGRYDVQIGGLMYQAHQD